MVYVLHVGNYIPFFYPHLLTQSLVLFPRVKIIQQLTAGSVKGSCYVSGFAYVIKKETRSLPILII